MFNDAENAVSFGKVRRLSVIVRDKRRWPTPYASGHNLHTSHYVGMDHILPDEPTVAITGCILTANPNAATARNAFNGGRNLHKLSFAPMSVLVMPIFVPTC